ncbi:hypothetical protein PHYPSEUDO_013292, partial [Phytophthora pseudosyringae]
MSVAEAFAPHACELLPRVLRDRGVTVKDIVTTVAITAIQADQVILKREAEAVAAKL